MKANIHSFKNKHNKPIAGLRKRILIKTNHK